MWPEEVGGLKEDEKSFFGERQIAQKRGKTFGEFGGLKVSNQKIVPDQSFKAKIAVCSHSF